MKRFMVCIQFVLATVLFAACSGSDLSGNYYSSSEHYLSFDGERFAIIEDGETTEVENVQHEDNILSYFVEGEETKLIHVENLLYDPDSCIEINIPDEDIFTAKYESKNKSYVLEFSNDGTVSKKINLYNMAVDEFSGYYCRKNDLITICWESGNFLHYYISEGKLYEVAFVEETAIDQETIANLENNFLIVYEQAQQLENEGQYALAAITYYRVLEFRDSEQRCKELWKKASPNVTIDAGDNHVVAISNSSSVVAMGSNEAGQCNVSDWNGIISVSAGMLHTIGLRADGTVIATEYLGEYDSGRCNVSEWTDIVAISAGNACSIGLKADGTVVATDFTGDYYYGQCDVSEWVDIVAISAGGRHTVALCSNGSVVATGDNAAGQCNVGEWKDIVAISAGEDFTVAVKKDGTVVATGNNDSGQCDVSTWHEITRISAGKYQTLGLRADGTVVSTNWKKHNQELFDNKEGQFLQSPDAVSNWEGIVEISASNSSYGLCKDGTVTAVGWNTFNQCELPWNNISVD